MEEDMAKNSYVSDAAQNNSEQNFGIAVSKLVEDALVNRHWKNEEFVDKVLGDDAMLRVLSEHLTRSLYRRLREAS